MPSEKRLLHSVLTDTGRRREHNEDAYAVSEKDGLYLVADGMGGMEAGEVASGIARDIITSEIARGMDLPHAIRAAHQSILEASAQGVGAAGMGTTVVAVKFEGNDFELAWVGDSRAYLWNPRQGTLERISRDHSQVELLIERGLITREQAHNHPQKNMITQALGQTGADLLLVDSFKRTLPPDTCLLLCSDGLTDELLDHDIAITMAQTDELDGVCHALVEKALAAGGRDNVTVLVIQRHSKGILNFLDGRQGLVAGLLGACLAVLLVLAFRFLGTE